MKKKREGVYSLIGKEIQDINYNEHGFIIRTTDGEKIGLIGHVDGGVYEVDEELFSEFEEHIVEGEKKMLEEIELDKAQEAISIQTSQSYWSEESQNKIEAILKSGKVARVVASTTFKEIKDTKIEKSKKYHKGGYVKVKILEYDDTNKAIIDSYHDYCNGASISVVGDEKESYSMNDIVDKMENN